MGKLGKDFIINFFITVMIALLSFLINRYFVLYLGVYNLGIMKLFSQLLAYLNLADVGLVSASTYALYKPLSEKDYKKVSVIVSTITSLYSKIFIFILLLGFAITPIIPFFIKDKILSFNIYLYWIMYVIGSTLNYTFIKYSILLTADQKYIFLRTIQGTIKIIVSIVQIFILIKFQSFILFISIIIIENLFQFIFFKRIFKRNYPEITETKEREISIFKNLKNLFWHKLGMVIVFNTDMILLSKFISIEIVGVYASYQMIVQIIIRIIMIFLDVLKPKICKRITENSYEENYEYFKYLNVIFLYISLFFSLAFLGLANAFMVLWLNGTFILGRFTLILITINLFITAFRMILEIFKEGSGYFDDIQLPIAEALINFIFSIILVNYLGINGVIIGTVVSNVLIICIAKPILVFKNCFKKSIFEYIELYIKYVFLIFLASIFNMLIFKNLIENVKIEKWLDWIKLTTIYSFILGIGILFIFLLNKDFRKIFIKRRNL